ncbi:MAG: translation initiation factor IF-2 [Myxococcota bacterium]|jgi:translation initiation factor IF-2|nr:translation initiation factor IF-2 [Myxococcota bacterium]
MAKIRAYKIAEELGIDRNEIVERAKSLGIDVPGPMASLDEDVAAALREKLGGHAPGAQVVERRVDAQGGSAVIRRRKRAPEPAPEPKVVEVAPPVAAEPIAPLETPEPEIEPAGDGMAPAFEPEPLEEGEPAPEIEAPAPFTISPVSGPAEAPAARAPGGRPGDFGGAAAAAAAAAGTGKERKRVREVVNLREQEQLAKQAVTRLMRRSTTIDPRMMQSPRRRKRDKGAALRPTASTPQKAAKRVVRADGSISVADLAHQLGAKAAEVQGRLMALGVMASVNQKLELEAASKVAAHYGFEVQNVGFQENEVIGEAAETASDETLVPRPPIVTVMGHVDHGKTSLLDAIRKTKVVAGEAGGITQHIGAYQASVGERKITFIDTPGHEAFTLMRARGAEVTDIVILVVAATEGIMPQTVEAINHAKAAEVPIIVAINKCDLPDANPQLCRQRLMEHGLVPEDFGGDTICVNVSALKGTGLDQLLELVALQADVLELRADPARRARGIVLEAQLDKGRGPVATVLVQDGTLKQGDAIVVGTAFGRVRAMENERGQRLPEAGPSTPVQIIGLSSVPEAGQVMHAVENERAARDVADHRASEERTRPAQARPRLSLDELFAQADGEGPKELRIVLKADVHGSAEAVRDALLKQATDTVKVNVILSGVGAISESDVMLAKASDAIVVGFHVRPDTAARRAAEGQGVDVRSYQIIYELTDEVRQAMAGLLPPKIEEKVLGRVEVRKTFNVPRIGTIAGCYVTEGMVRRNAKARLLRDGVQVWEGGFASLKRFKDDVREVQTGFECGIGLDGYNDLKVGDVIEPYEIVETRAALT